MVPPDDHAEGAHDGEPEGATPVEVPTEVTGGVLRIDAHTIREIADLGVAQAVAVNAAEPLTVEELREAWPVLDVDERSDGLKLLEQEDAEDLFTTLSARDHVQLLLSWRPGKRRSWMRLLEPDDIADVVQEAPDEARGELMALLDERTRKEVQALLAYAEDDAGGLMNTRYARLRPGMTADEAISYLRRQAREALETIYYAYVLDPDQKLLGVVSFRDLLTAPPRTTVAEFMETDVIRANDEMDQETLSRLFAEQDLPVIPVVDQHGVMKGIVTVDDIVDVVEEEATEDIQKMGGMQALEQPYLESSLGTMIKSRGVWLTVLMVGEMLTATAMGFFQDEIGKAVVLTVFIPLIISSGGNSGSQASTLVIRAMALGEVRGRDWWRVVRREILTGLALGGILGVIGLIRIVLWQAAAGSYGDHYLLIGLVVGFSLIGVVMFGTLAGSMLPFLLRKLGADPASASAPFVATLVDVTGLVIYFTVAHLLLSGSML
ncbi:MAG: magnesium transporter [Kofleriaceae bacterium]|nr:magnesium transporter [Myxococcales bacterium]MCB9561209.1 magnesium transporter [Kofleriaceae bacterium]